jgi:hypothetical protein
MFSVEDLYIVENKKIKNIAKKDHDVNWIGGSCVYKILIGDQVVHVGRSDTCKKHGGAEKTRKAIVQLLGWEKHNPGITTTKIWKNIKDKYTPDIKNINVEIIFTDNIEKVYNKEMI